MRESTSTIGPQPDRSIFTDTMVELTWPEVEAAARRGDVVLLPVAVVEAHGPHMDLSPDIHLGCVYARLLKQRLRSKGIGAVIAPPLYWGISEDLKKYPGSFSTRPETFRALLADVFGSLASWGFRLAFVVNSHGDPTHRRTITQAIQDLGEQPPLRVHELDGWDLAVPAPTPPPPRPGRFEEDYHAGARETACMQLFFPDRVNTELARTLAPRRGFDPLAYYGDPASYHLERDLVAAYEADLETDALRIQAVLRA